MHYAIPNIHYGSVDTEILEFDAVLAVLEAMGATRGGWFP
jgi:hypothetical protein